jgi:hypothetical protein
LSHEHSGPAHIAHIEGSDSDCASDSASDEEDEEEDGLVGKDPLPPTPVLTYDKDDPPMNVGNIYPNMYDFRIALSQHAIKREFEFNIEKSDPGRVRVYCSRKKKKEACRWRLHARTMCDGITMKVMFEQLDLLSCSYFFANFAQFFEMYMQVTRNPHEHGCSSARRIKGVRNATKFWVCEQVKDWLVEDASVGAKELVRRIKDKHKVKVPYRRVYDGMKLAKKQLFGSWESSFDNLFRFKAEVESCSPGSWVIIDHHEVEEKNRFHMLFFAMKPCVDGFLKGCRPYLAIDSTFLTGMFRGQLACAIAVDGHNWMYPVAVGVIDSETSENWIWFLQKLRDAIGAPPGLAICTDAGPGVMAGVKEVFPNAEHRECMLHLASNFKKRYNVKIFEDHLRPAAYSWSPYFVEKHWKAMEDANPDAMAYIR